MRVLSALTITASALLGLLTLGQLIPLPLADFVGGVAVVYWAWVALAAAALLVTAVLLWRRRRTVPRAVAALLACLALAVYGTAGARQVAWAQQQGAEVTAGSVLGVAQVADVPDATISCADSRGRTLPATVYTPANPGGAPVLVWIHGGAWNSGSHTATVHNRWLADRGYLVYSLEYTLASSEEHTWDQLVPQLQCGIQTIADDAATRGANTSAVGLLGESAGGHLALLLGTTMPITGACGGEMPEVAAVAVEYPAANPGLTAGLDPLMAAVTRQRQTLLAGCTATECPERFTAITPGEHVRADSAPSLLVVPEKDHVVPPQGAFDLVARLQETGVDTEALVVPAADHGFDGNTADLPAQVFRLRAVEWLEQHGLEPVG
ncbi:hypothetical protein AXF14_04275 [Actinomyces radicidentis]|uniref:BD-FAE-like domain-containing protein n=1 Tax=Actinomyces radicidentis TaxID=111015 RepID=A0A109W2D2_ACTRD|nr:alpha/beta hydrolase [Actinomyces radicidentis]AMD86956.1 hypothetical protein AXF14_04275 [Actinomyces radicidentis]